MSQNNETSKPLRAGPIVTTMEQIEALSRRIEDAESILALVRRALEENDPTAAEQILAGIEPKLGILLPIVKRDELPTDPPSLTEIRTRIASLLEARDELKAKVTAARNTT